jgi:hypothetical protein
VLVLIVAEHQLHIITNIETLILPHFDNGEFFQKVLTS